jgi:hypothetical protein
MATLPQRDPIEDEAARVLAENPGLREELEEFGRAYDAGEVPASELIPNEVAARRLAEVLAAVEVRHAEIDLKVDPPDLGL